MFRFTIGSRPVVAFAEPDAINAILRERPDGYRRWREAEDVFRELGIHGVFSAEGGEWRKQRRLAVMALNTNHLHRYFDVIRVSTERLRGRLERAARSGEPFELQRAFMSFTTDVASSLAFGQDLNTLEHESELQSHIERVFPMLSRRIAAPFPYWRYVKPPADRAAERSLVEIRAAVDGFIAQARERMQRRPELWEQPENFLESMLAAQREGRYSDEEVFGNTFQILLAGEDTTAHSLTWAAWFIARDRALQRRLAEAAPVIEDADTTFEYGDAVLRETMRLKSVAPLIFVEPLRGRHGRRRRAAARHARDRAHALRGRARRRRLRSRAPARPEALPDLRRRPALLPGPQPRTARGALGAGDARSRLRDRARPRGAAGARALRLHDAADRAARASARPLTARISQYHSDLHVSASPAR